MSALLPGISNISGSFVLTSATQDFIFARKLVAYSFNANWQDAVTLNRAFMAWSQLQLQIDQPLNQSLTFGLGTSAPVGGFLLTFNSNTVFLPGNLSALSILPVPIKVGRIVLTAQDTLSIGNSINIDATLFWESPKPTKFVGD